MRVMVRIRNILKWLYSSVVDPCAVQAWDLCNGLRQRLHERGFKSTRFHDFETASKFKIGAVSNCLHGTVFATRSKSWWYKRALHYVLNSLPLRQRSHERGFICNRIVFVAVTPSVYATLIETFAETLSISNSGAFSKRSGFICRANSETWSIWIRLLF